MFGTAEKLNLEKNFTAKCEEINDFIKESPISSNLVIMKDPVLKNAAPIYYETTDVSNTLRPIYYQQSFPAPSNNAEYFYPGEVLSFPQQQSINYKPLWTDNSFSNQQILAPPAISVGNCRSASPLTTSSTQKFDMQHCSNSSLQQNSEKNLCLGKKSNHKDFQNYNKKANAFNKYRRSPLAEDDLSNIEVNLEKIGISTVFDTKPDFFSIISRFRSLSVHLIQLINERQTLKKTLLNKPSQIDYHPNINYVPTSIHDLSKHLDIIKGIILRECDEIDKLLKTIPFKYNEFDKINTKLYDELNKLQEFEDIRIRHKNGMLLLPNDKIISMHSVICNLIEIICEYATYIKVLKFRINNNKVSNENPRMLKRNVGM